MRLKAIVTSIAVCVISLFIGSSSAFAANPFASTTITVDQLGTYNNGLIQFSSANPIFGLHGSATTWDLETFGDVSNWTVGVEVQLLAEGSGSYLTDGVLDDLCNPAGDLAVPNCLDLGVNFTYSSYYMTPNATIYDSGGCCAGYNNNGNEDSITKLLEKFVAVAQASGEECHDYYGDARRPYVNRKCLLQVNTIYDYQLRLNVTNYTDYPGLTYYSKWFPIDPALRFRVGNGYDNGICNQFGFPTDIICRLFDPRAATDFNSYDSGDGAFQGYASSTFLGLIGEVGNKPPFGYIHAVSTILFDLGTTTSTSTERTLNSSIVTALPVLFNPFKLAFGIFLWFLFLVYLFKRFVHFEL